jgi:hypothetical protein
LNAGSSASNRCRYAINQRRAPILGVVRNGDQTQDPGIEHLKRYRLVVVVLLGARFLVLDVLLVLDVPLVVFFDVDFAEVVAGFETDLLTVFAGVLLVVREATLLDPLGAVRVEDALLDPVAVLRPAGEVAIASIRGAGCFFFGIVARTCLMAVVCSSRVILNSWCPSRLATKYR